MQGQSLAHLRLTCKRLVAKGDLRHFSGVSKSKKEPKSVLQEVFLRRVREELDRQGLSENALSKRVGAPPQRTINSTMNGRDPTLATVNAFAIGLGVHPWQLLVDKSAGSGAKTHTLPTYPPMMKMGSADKSRDRKKRAG
jgi:ribosome-binding protein aMBF1 (putative translation factor)